MTTAPPRKPATRPRPEPVARDGRSSWSDLDGSDAVCLVLVLTLLVPAAQVVPGVGTTPGGTAAMALAFLWVALHLGRNLPVAKGTTPVRLVVLVLVGAWALAFINGMYGYLTPGETTNSQHTIILFTATVGLSLFVTDVIRSREGVLHIVRALVTAASVVAAAGIVEGLVGVPFVKLFHVPGLRVTDVADFTQAPRDDLIRAQSTTGHPIEFGVLCVMAVPFALHLAVTAREHRSRVLAWTCLAVLCTGAVFSISRSAIVGLAAAGAILLLGASPRDRVRGLLAVVVGGAVLWAAAPRVVGALVSFFASASTDPSVGSRTGDYATVLQEFLRHPVLGRGPGTWYAPVHQIFDNQYLLTLVETGLVGLVATLAMFGTTAWRAAALHARAHGPRQTLPLACLASVAVVATTYATFDFGSFSTVNTTAFVLLGIVGALDRIDASTGSRARLVLRGGRAAHA